MFQSRGDTPWGDPPCDWVRRFPSAACWSHFLLLAGRRAWLSWIDQALRPRLNSPNNDCTTAFIHHKTNAHCFALISAQFEQIKVFLTRLLIQIHWLFKARFRSIHTLHGCTVFPAMVLWKYNWSWSGNAPALRQHYAWREPWPCCVQLVRKSAQKIASEPLPFYPCEVTLTSNSSSPFASVGLFELSFTLMTLGSSCGGGHQAHFTGAAKQLR